MGGKKIKTLLNSMYYTVFNIQQIVIGIKVKWGCTLSKENKAIFVMIDGVFV